MEIDPSQRPSILTPMSQGTGLAGPAPSTSSIVPSTMETVNEFVTPTKAQMRQAMNQMHYDMQYNVQAAHDFVRKNELQTDQKCEAILKEQQHRFEVTAREWELSSHDQTLLEVADARNTIEQQANDVFNELNARIRQEASYLQQVKSNLANAQHEAQAESRERQAAADKISQVESAAQKALNKQHSDLQKEAYDAMGKLNAQGTEIVQNQRAELAEVRAMLKTAEERAALESQQKEENLKRMQKAEDLNQRLQVSLHEEGNLFQEASRSVATLKTGNFKQQVQLDTAGKTSLTAHSEMKTQSDQSELQKQMMEQRVAEMGLQLHKIMQQMNEAEERHKKEKDAKAAEIHSLQSEVMDLQKDYAEVQEAHDNLLVQKQLWLLNEQHLLET